MSDSARSIVSTSTARRAAIRAGYSPKSAEQTASYLLRIPVVSEAIEARAHQAIEKLDVSTDQILEHVSKVAFARKPSKHVRVSDKVRALELLMRHTGLVGEHQVNVGVNVQPLFTIAPDSQARVK